MKIIAMVFPEFLLSSSHFQYTKSQVYTSKPVAEQKKERLREGKQIFPNPTVS